jgi:hypothetical protein
VRYGVRDRISSLWGRSALTVNYGRDVADMIR